MKLYSMKQGDIEASYCKSDLPLVRLRHQKVSLMSWGIAIKKEDC